MFRPDPRNPQEPRRRAGSWGIPRRLDARSTPTRGSGDDDDDDDDGSAVEEIDIETVQTATFHNHVFYDDADYYRHGYAEGLARRSYTRGSGGVWQALARAMSAGGVL
jgi:hypothetical protein